jgi:energy-coupling factor transporter ATP-binding protein EcfA2
LAIGMYDFRTLSPLDFENLARDLIQAELGLRLESFGPGRDLGIDFRFAVGQGSAIVQAKHYPDEQTDRLVRAVARENAKVERLKPKRYILVTSASLTPLTKQKLVEALPAVAIRLEDILGRADLNNLLTRHPEVERQHFKLWLASTTVLERILHSGVYNRTEAEMDEIKAIVPKYVHNKSLQEAESILAKHGTLIIAGEPGIGKSTLARMLIWLHTEQDWRISVIDDIAEAFEIGDGKEKRLIFFDDFLGQVGLTRDLIRGMDQRFPPFFKRVRANPNLRFVLTTRDYILAQAQAQSQRLSAAEVNSSEFILNVSHYTRAIRAQILFNHIYFATLGADERDALLADDFFLRMIDHRNFNPRLIDLLTTGEYISISGRPIRETVLAVLENPEELWEKPYRNHISGEGRALMFAVFFNASRIRLAALERSFGRMVHALGIAVPSADIAPRFRAALKELEGSVVAVQDRTVSFSNPGIRDFLKRAIVRDQQLAGVLTVASEYDEVVALREYFAENKTSFPTVTGDLWLGAATRLVGGGLADELRQLGLVIDLYDDLRLDAFLPVVNEAVNLVGGTEFDDLDVDLCVGLLERVVMTLLPSEYQENAREVLSTTIGELLASSGSVTSLDDIERLGSALKTHGSSENGAVTAVQNALEGHADNLSEFLGEIRSLDDVEEYERDFNRLRRSYGASAVMASYYFERRREDLSEDLPQDDENRYGASHKGSPTQDQGISDDQIRSMFVNLRGE